MQSIFSRLAPFIMLGIAIVAFFLMAYVIMIGACIGTILFAAVWLRNKFFPSNHKEIVKRGRTYDHDELK